MSEDDIIAEGFSLVREGLISGDWSKVSEGYNLVSGEDLKPPEKQKTKLEKIREGIQSKKKISKPEKTIDNDQIEEENEGKILVSQMNIRELKVFLTSSGYGDGFFKDKSKKDLLEIAKSIQSQTNKDDDLGDRVGTKTTLFRGGEKFAVNGINIVESVVDPEEAEKNKVIASKTMNLPPRQRSSAFTNDINTDNPNREWGYHSKPPKRFG